MQILEGERFQYPDKGYIDISRGNTQPVEIPKHYAGAPVPEIGMVRYMPTTTAINGARWSGIGSFRCVRSADTFQHRIKPDSNVTGTKR